MKKWIVLFIVCAFFGCNKPEKRGALNEWMNPDSRVKVLSTTAIVGDLVKSIGGDEIDQVILIEGDIDPHSYELVKGDHDKLARADIVFANGLGLEHGASLDYWLHHHESICFVGDEIYRLTPEKIIVLDGQADPHIWTDVSLWMTAIDAVVARLSTLAPQHEETFEERGELLKVEWCDLHKRLLSEMETVPLEKRYLVTSHDAFNYFARAYLGDDGEERFVAPEGLSPDGQLSSLDIQEIVSFLQAHPIGVVFPESNLSPHALSKIVFACQEKGVDISLAQHPLYGDSMGEESYGSMMEYNVRTIASYLKGEANGD